MAKILRFYKFFIKIWGKFGVFKTQKISLMSVKSTLLFNRPFCHDLIMNRDFTTRYVEYLKTNIYRVLTAIFLCTKIFNKDFNHNLKGDDICRKY